MGRTLGGLAAAGDLTGVGRGGECDRSDDTCGWDQGGTETHGRPFRWRYWIRQVSESNTNVQKNAQ